MTFQVSRTLHLSRPESFYTSSVQFEVEIVPDTCKSYSDGKGNSYKLELDQSMCTALQPYTTQRFTASIEELTKVAMRFYMPKGPYQLKGVLYDEALFLLRWNVGTHMETTSGNSIGKSPLGTGLRMHSETEHRVIEMLAYGVALSFMSKVLGVNSTRFYFLTETGSGAKPDFAVTMTPEKLARIGVRVLSPNGTEIQIEVKGRSKATKGATKDTKLLLNLAKKCHNAQNCIFVAIVVNFPKDASTAEWRSKIQVYDPGVAEPLPRKRQVEILLRQVVFQSYRFGLWGTLQKCFDDFWMEYLEPLSAAEKEVQQIAFRSSKAIQGRFLTREFNGRKYRGRFFVTASEQLGEPKARLVTPDEARAILKSGDFGPKWFRGIDIELEQIIDNMDVIALLGFGIRDDLDQRRRRDSAFISTLPDVEDRSLDRAEELEIRRIYERALEHFDRDGIW